MSERRFPAVDLTAVSSHTFLLKDGRSLAYARYGDPNGSPVYYFHGSPSSRLEAAVAHPTAQAHALDLYALDRPGCGASSPAAGYRLLDWAADVAAFADGQGHQQFGIMGFSGGGAYVNACAHQFPQRLLFAYDLSGWGPVAQIPELTEELAPLDRFFMQRADQFGLLFRLPFALVGWAASWLSDQRFATAIRSSLSQDDRDFLQNDPHLAAYLRHIVRSSFAQGSRGPADDAIRLYTDWGFAMEDICFPIQFWQGTDDKFVATKMARYKHQAVAGSTLRLFEGRGHMHMMTLFGELFVEAKKMLTKGLE